MRSTLSSSILSAIGTAVLLSGNPAVATTQSSNEARTRLASASGDIGDVGDEAVSHVVYKFKSSKDSLQWERARALANRETSGFKLVVSLQDAHIWALVGSDTVLSAPAAVAKGTTLEFGNSKWNFETPRGARTVLGKEANPIWQPPEWLYAETAAEHGLKLGHLSAGQKRKLGDGRFLTVRDGEVGIIENGQFAAMPTDEHIVFGDTLFVPPMGTKNRKVEGELGKFRLILGDGYLIHGTPYKDSIGLAATHGCVRLRDEDIEWLYDHVPVGTKVYIY
jgi:hypothetical protein